MLAHSIHCSQATQAGRDGACELVLTEPSKRVISKIRFAAKVEARFMQTHNCCSPVKLPKLGGMVPVSWLWYNDL